MLLLSLVFSTFRPIVPLNLLGIPVAAIGLILGFAFSRPDQFIEQHSLGLDTHIILSLSAYAVLLMATIHAILIWFQTVNSKTKNVFGSIYFHPFRPWNLYYLTSSLLVLFY